MRGITRHCDIKKKKKSRLIVFFFVNLVINYDYPLIIYLLFYSFFIYFYRDFRKLSKTGPIYNPSVYSDWYLAMHLKSITLPTLDTLQRIGKHVPSWKSHFENLEESFFYHDLTESLHSGQLTPQKNQQKFIRYAMWGQPCMERLFGKQF